MAINGSLDRLLSLETSKMPLGSMYIILSSTIACIFILPLIVLVRPMIVLHRGYC